ncbi:hypothetical protein VNO80_27315 [Phaseolus coccineus]|uniref:Uncharacterized protein n=1 Tax=Phaseolus coccineus TaxID=3886 RepID=A0AAN9QHE1_PHACN
MFREHLSKDSWLSSALFDWWGIAKLKLSEDTLQLCSQNFGGMKHFQLYLPLSFSSEFSLSEEDQEFSVFWGATGPVVGVGVSLPGAVGNSTVPRTQTYSRSFLSHQLILWRIPIGIVQVLSNW